MMLLVVPTRLPAEYEDVLETERDKDGCSGLIGVALRLGIDAGVLCAATADQLGEGGGGMAAE